MDRIEIKILEHNCNGMPRFLAKLTQRGHDMKDMSDVIDLYDKNIDETPSEELMSLPHTTLQRMNYITVAITGLSTKAVSQLRTHAKRLTFLSTSTQYSSFDNREDNFVYPTFKDDIYWKINEAYIKINEIYKELLNDGVDKDIASYILPQALRKTLIISGNVDDWNYVLKTRLCNRNTSEVQKIALMIYLAIKKECGEEYLQHALPECINGEWFECCREGNFCCCDKFNIKRLKDKYDI